MATIRPIEARVLLQIGDAQPVEVGTIEIPILVTAEGDDDG